MILAQQKNCTRQCLSTLLFIKKWRWIVYFSVISNVILAQDSLSVTYDLASLSIEQLMDIRVISVSKRAEKLTEVPSAIQIITQEDIRRSGATSIPEALRLSSNLQVAQVNSSQWAISARGFNNVLANKLLVLIDGRTVYTPMYAGVFWDIQNVLLEDVDRIEVISGPGGTLWGANAVNGVINIITKNTKDTKGLFAEAVGGTELTMGSLRYGGKITDHFSYRLYALGFKRNSTVLTDGTDAKDKWDLGQGGLRLDWAREKNLLTFQSDFYDGKPNPDGSTNNVITRGGNAIARWTHTFSEKSAFQLQVYYDQTWRDFRNGLTEDLKTYDLDIQHHFKAGQRQTITWGMGLRGMEQTMQNLELFAFLPAYKPLHLYNAFIQDEIVMVKERLYLTLGTKIEHNSYTDFEYEPNIRLNWLASEKHTVWAAASRAVKIPARIDRDFRLYLIAPTLPLMTGSPDFISEEVIAYELGWRMKPMENFSFSLATFYNFYDNIRSAEPGPKPFNIPITFSNGVKGETYGVELSTLYQLTNWWRLKGGYTFLKKHLSIKASSKDLNGGRAESNDPQNQFLIQSMTDLPAHLELGIVVRYVDVLHKPNVPSYVGLDVQLEWKMNKFITLSVAGQNLLDNRHPEFVPSSPSPREIERSFYGKIKFYL